MLSFSPPEQASQWSNSLPSVFQEGSVLCWRDELETPKCAITSCILSHILLILLFTPKHVWDLEESIPIHFSSQSLILYFPNPRASGGCSASAELSHEMWGCPPDATALPVTGTLCFLKVCDSRVPHSSREVMAPGRVQRGAGCRQHRLAVQMVLWVSRKGRSAWLSHRSTTYSSWASCSLQTWDLCACIVHTAIMHV